MAGIFCYCHIDGDILRENNRINYIGGRTIGLDLASGTSYLEFRNKLSDVLQCDVSNRPIKYTVKYDQTVLIDLNDDKGTADFIRHNNGYGHVYILANIPSGGSSKSDHSSNVLRHGLICTQLSQQLDRGSSSEHAVPTFSAMQFADVLTGKGQMFENAEELRVALYKFSLAHGFEYKFHRNSPNRIHVACKAEGCGWVLIACGIQKTGMLIVRTYEATHTHSAQDVLNVKHRRNAKMLASVAKTKFSMVPDMPPNALRGEFVSEFGMKLSYKQAWRCKERCIEELHGDPAGSYMLIPWYCKRLQETDPSTIAIWESSEDRSFKHLFVAYGCSLRGFNEGCRPLLFIDGCHLSGPYKGTLLSANAIDADNDLYPLAYGVVCGETYVEWTWFLNKLKGAVGNVDLTIISDRHEAIKGAVGTVFGHACHAFCYRHVKEDFSAQVRKYCRGIKRAKEDALSLLDRVAYARLDYKCNEAIENLRAFSAELASWVENNSDVEKWALSRFPRMRWEKITTNVAESFNAWVVKERGHNIFQFMKEHHEKLAVKIFGVKQQVSKWKNGVGPKVENKLAENVFFGAAMNAMQYGQHEYRIQMVDADFTVNLEHRSCSCKEWQLSGIPCMHACAAIKLANGNVYTFVHECYQQRVQTSIYEHTMLPVDTNDMPDLDHESLETWMAHEFLQPPLTSNPPGRPQKKRRESQFSNKRYYYCSRCFQCGHNRSTCKNPNPI